jgi:hypothetical protein
MTTTSRDWGAGNFGKGGNVSTLEGVVRQLNPAAKQAMYGAANKGLIRRGTWDGCAFNAGGVEVGNNNVGSTFAAAQQFNLPSSTVTRFIEIWDSTNGTDEECTERLKAAILDAGLFTEANESKGRRVLRQTIYKSQETQLREKFEAEVASLDMSDVHNETVADISAMSELLSSCSS